MLKRLVLNLHIVATVGQASVYMNKLHVPLQNVMLNSLQGETL